MKLTEYRGIDIEVTPGGEFFARLPVSGTDELARTPAATVRDLQKAIDRALARQRNKINLKAALLRKDGQAVTATRISVDGDLLVKPAALRYAHDPHGGWNRDKYYPDVEGMAELLAHRFEISSHLQVLDHLLQDVAVSQRHGYRSQNADTLDYNTKRAAEAIAKAYESAAAGLDCPALGCGTHD